MLAGALLAPLLAVAMFLAWSTARQDVATASFGVCAYANEVVSYTPGSGITDANASNPSNALGVEDAAFVSLGHGGSITLKFSLPAAPSSSAEILVIEIEHNEGAHFEVSEDGTTYVSLGSGSGNVSLDISGTGLSLVRYIRITDDNDGVPSEPQGGFDLDAVEVFSCTEEPPPPPPPPPAGDEGCTPGYWKTKPHLSQWAATGYSTGDDFDTVFGVDAFNPNITLLQAVSLIGDSFNSLTRHAVAGLLNAAHPDVDYPLTSAQVIALYQAAIAPGGDLDAAKATLQSANEATCPLD